MRQVPSRCQAGGRIARRSVNAFTVDLVVEGINGAGQIDRPVHAEIHHPPVVRVELVGDLRRWQPVRIDVRL